jgi:hypothetical protein
MRFFIFFFFSSDLLLVPSGMPKKDLEFCLIPIHGSSVSDPYPDPHGSALDLSPGSGSAFRMRIRILQLINLAPKAKKKNSYHLELFD